MRKLLTFIAAFTLIASTNTFAQKIDIASVKEKLAKADADCENPKKNIKAATWVKRGELYSEAIINPTKSLFVGITQPLLEAASGKGKAGSETIGTTKFKTISYSLFKAYLNDKNNVVSWVVTKQIDTKATDKAIESFTKAVEIDPSLKGAVSNKLKALDDYYKQLGTLAANLNQFRAASDAYILATRVEKTPAYDKLDPTLLFIAGYMLTLDGEKNPQSYVRGEKILREAVTAGYDAVEDANEGMKDAKERGNIYYYGFHCAYAQREGKPNKAQDAKKWLIEGVDKYPMNEKIFEGLLQLYTTESGFGDPTELLPTIEKSIATNNDDEMAWFGRGRIYFAIKNYDECINSFKEVVRINPGSFEGNFYLGLFYMLKGDDFGDTITSATYTDQKKYDSDIAELNKKYGLAIAPFEAAYVLKPTDKSTLDYLKQICFRLRYDDEATMAKFEKYNKLFNELK